TSSCDGPAAVWAKVADAQGYESEPRVAEIVLDTAPPDLLPDSAEIDVVPGPSSPLRTPRALGPGSLARVSFAATEPVVTPTVSAILDGASIALSPIVIGASAFTYGLRAS